MATNDFRPPIASPPENPPATIEQIDNRRPDMDWGTWRTAPLPKGGSLTTLPVGSKRNSN